MANAQRITPDYLGEGTHAARPTPGSGGAPTIPSGGVAIYNETDTGHQFLWSPNASAWIDITPSGAVSSGLYSGLLSAAPTSASTGLTTWVNQSTATVSDTVAGVLITASSNTALNLRTKASPAAPFTITALVAVAPKTNSGASVGIGWYDGTNKIHILTLALASGNMGLVVDRFSTPTTFSAAESGTLLTGTGGMMWLQINDDNAGNVNFRAGQDGVNFVTMFTTSKASGYLGSGGYTNVCLNASGAGAMATLMSWLQA